MVVHGLMDRPGCGFRVLGFRVLGFRVLGFRVLGFRVTGCWELTTVRLLRGSWDLWGRVSALGAGVWDLTTRVPEH